MKKFYILTLGILFLLFYVAPTSAHWFKKELSIGVIFHIAPSHYPKVGDVNTLSFQINDTSNQFKPEECDCNALILLNEKLVHKELLYKNTKNIPLGKVRFEYAFPKDGTYKIKFVAEPKEPETFKSTSMEWDLKVAPAIKNSLVKSKTSEKKEGGTGEWMNKYMFHLLFSGVIFTCMITYFIRRKLSKVKA